MIFHPYINAYAKLISILLLLISISKITSNKEVFTLKMESICSKAEDYINIFFNEYKEINEKIKNYSPNNPLTKNDEEIIKMLLFDKNAKNFYIKKKFYFLKILHIIFIILLILSIFIIIIFSIHLISKLYCQNDDDENSKINFFKLVSISPFSFFTFFSLSKEKVKEYYNKYQSQKLFKLSKKFDIFFLIILLGLFISTLTLTIFNIIQVPIARNALNNMSCSFSKFIYELDNTPLKKSDFIGLSKIYDFLSILKENSNNLDNDLKNFNKSYNEEVKITIKKWNSLLNQINANLSDQNTMEYFIETFPSDPICGEVDCSNYTKHKYQLKLLFDYYPHNESEKRDRILYKTNEKLQEFYSTINQILEDFDHKFIYYKNQNISIDKNSIFYKIIIKSESIFEYYINQYSLTYLEKVNDVINSILSFINVTNYLYLILLLATIGLSIAFIQHIFLQSCMINKFILIIILINNILFILFLSILTSLKILHIKEKIIYIQDIIRGIYIIFDKKNINYFKGKSSTKINNIDINIYENDVEINQLFYYLNNIINNNGIISNLYPLNEFNSSLKDILDISNKIYILSYQKTTFNYSLLNNDINKYNQIINNFLTNGLQYNTNFYDVTGNGNRQTGIENPMTYLYNVNMRTRKERRDVFEFVEIICDETWNISTYNYYWFKYAPREKILCNGCINICTDKKILLNWIEYTLDEIIERYKFLNYSSNNDTIKIYNELVFEFTAVEELRNEKIFKQVNNLKEFNSQLMKLQNDLYNQLKISLNYANDIINICKNIFSDYANENSTKLYSFLDCDFIRNDLNFILYETENYFLPELNILYQNHLLLNINSMLFSFIFLFFYSITSYQPLKNEMEEILKKKLKDEIDKKLRDKDASKIDLINIENTGKYHFYNTIVLQNQQHKKDEKQDNVLKLIDNDHKSVKQYCTSNDANSKKLL